MRGDFRKRQPASRKRRAVRRETDDDDEREAFNGPGREVDPSSLPPAPIAASKIDEK